MFALCVVFVCCLLFAGGLILFSPVRFRYLPLSVSFCLIPEPPDARGELRHPRAGGLRSVQAHLGPAADPRETVQERPVRDRTNLQRESTYPPARTRTRTLLTTDVS